MNDNSSSTPQHGDQRVIAEGIGSIFMASIITFLIATFVSLKVILAGHSYGYLLSFMPVLAWGLAALMANWLVSLCHTDTTFRSFGIGMRRFAAVAGGIYLTGYVVISFTILLSHL